MKRSSKYSAQIPKEDLRFISYCPLCHTYFSPQEAKVLEEAGDTHLLHFMCRKCFSSIVILVLASDLGVSSFGLITDLTEGDVMRFKDQPAVSPNDVITIYSLFEDIDNFYF